MLERIILATVITFCIYLFLNLGGESSSTPSLSAKNDPVSKFVNQITSF